MEHSEGKGHDPEAPETTGDGKPSPGVGPVGRTRSEDQRRRLIVAGLSTPALMTLPSRRVWASKCTKSKLLSGNLSAKKKMTLECEPMGCGRSFWKSNDGQDFDGRKWMLERFNTWFPGDPNAVFTDDTFGYLVDANDGDWEMSLTPAAQIAFGAADPLPPYDDKYKDDAAKAFIKAARELATAWLNDQYIRWPVPNDQFNFEKNAGFPMDGLREEFWSSTMMMWMAPSSPPTGWTQQKKGIYDLARDAGHWASEYLKYEAIEKSLPSGTAKDAAKAEKDAAQDLFNAAVNFLKDCEAEIKALNELVCPFS